METHSSTPTDAAPTFTLEQKSSIRQVPGGFWWRVLASFVDSCVLGLLNFPITMAVAVLHVAAGGNDSSSAVPLALVVLQYAIQFTVMFFYFGWFYKHKGATPGKALVGLRVVSADTGANLSYWRSFGRETIGKFLGIILLGIGFLMAAWTKEKTALHDLLFSTRVVKRIGS